MHGENTHEDVSYKKKILTYLPVSESSLAHLYLLTGPLVLVD